MNKTFAMIGAILGSGLGLTILGLVTQHVMAIKLTNGS
jgi:hypothetical protein